MLSLFRQHGQIVHFAVRADLRCAGKDSNAPLRKLGYHPLNDVNRRIRHFVHAKKNLEVFVVLQAKARKILVRAKIDSAHRFQNADRRVESDILFLPRSSKETDGSKDSHQVIRKRRNCCYQQRTPPHGNRNNGLQLIRPHPPARSTPKCGASCTGTSRGFGLTNQFVPVRSTNVTPTHTITTPIQRFTETCSLSRYFAPTVPTT